MRFSDSHLSPGGDNQRGRETKCWMRRAANYLIIKVPETGNKAKFTVRYWLICFSFYSINSLSFHKARTLFLYVYRCSTSSISVKYVNTYVLFLYM